MNIPREWISSRSGPKPGTAMGESENFGGSSQKFGAFRGENKSTIGNFLGGGVVSKYEKDDGDEGCE